MIGQGRAGSVKRLAGDNQAAFAQAALSAPDCAVPQSCTPRPHADVVLRLAATRRAGTDAAPLISFARVGSPSSEIALSSGDLPPHGPDSPLANVHVRIPRTRLPIAFIWKKSILGDENCLSISTLSLGLAIFSDKTTHVP